MQGSVVDKSTSSHARLANCSCTCASQVNDMRGREADVKFFTAASALFTRGRNGPSQWLQ
jgi:hypothetical protein